MNTFFKATIVVAATLGLGGQALAACKADKAGDELSGDEAKAVYDCLAADLHAAYKKGGKGWIPKAFVDDYRGWTLASAFPAAPGFHGERFLVTWVSEPGAAAYLKYEENPSIPAGTVIAKESFSVNDKGAVTMGPLFIMQKVETGKSPETMDWYYMMVGTNGKPQAVNVMTACNECHVENFGAQGGLGYPVEEARIQ